MCHWWINTEWESSIVLTVTVTMRNHNQAVNDQGLIRHRWTQVNTENRWTQVTGEHRSRVNTGHRWTQVTGEHRSQVNKVKTGHECLHKPLHTLVCYQQYIEVDALVTVMARLVRNDTIPITSSNWYIACIDTVQANMFHALLPTSQRLSNRHLVIVTRETVTTTAIAIVATVYAQLLKPGKVFW